MTEMEWLASADPLAMLRWLTRSEPGGTLAGWNCSHRKLRLFACACARQVWDLLVDDVACGRCEGCGFTHDGGGGNRAYCHNCSGTGRINRSLRAIEVAERYADGRATYKQCRDAYVAAYDAFTKSNDFEKELALKCCGSLDFLLDNSGLPRWFSVSTKLAADQAALLRDIFGNPHRPRWVYPRVTRADLEKPLAPLTERVRHLPLSWLTWNNGTVPRLAQHIYDTRDFGLLLELVDALQEAGCADEDILNHCREDVLVPCFTGCKKVAGTYRVRGKICPSCHGASGGVVVSAIHVRGCWVLDLMLGKC